MGRVIPSGGKVIGMEKREAREHVVFPSWDTIASLIPTGHTYFGSEKRRERFTDAPWGITVPNDLYFGSEKRDPSINMAKVVLPGQNPCEVFPSKSWTVSLSRALMLTHLDLAMCVSGASNGSGEEKRDQFNNMPKVVSTGEDPCKYYPGE